MYSRKFATEKDAEAYLEERGTLRHFGRSGVQSEFGVYHFYHNDGRKYHCFIYRDGMVEVEEFSQMQYHEWKNN